MTALSPDVVADLERENARLRAELRTARDRQAGSAEVLRAIASTRGNAEEALRQITEITARLFGAPSATLSIIDGDQWGRTIRVGASSKRIGAEVSVAQRRIGGRNLPGTVVFENRQIHIPDLDNVDPSMADWPGLPPARAEGTRVMSGTPLRRDGKAIGVLIVYCDRPSPFTDEELALQQSFADQAVIVIENSRLFNETQEALERQNASGEILRTIASAPGDASRSLQQVAETTARLFRASSVTVLVASGEQWGQTIRVGEGSNRIAEALPHVHVEIRPEYMPGAVFLENRQIHIPDLDNLDPAMTSWPGLPPARAAGTRSMSGTPLRREGKPIGALIVHRDRLAPFTADELALLQSFADQAVIAIENARLFNETKEALERQTATADILKVIASSPSDVQPVFEAIAARAKSLVGGFSSTVFRFIDGIAHLEAFTPTTPEADEILKSTFPRRAEDFVPFRMTQAGEVMQIPDTETLTDDILGISRARGFRSMVFAPLMNKGASIGFIAVTRVQPGSFTDHHVQVLRTFADQAVIAIENTRLFEEVQARTRDLTEALRYQTGSANILNVIASSPTDVGPVLKAIVESACDLCGAYDAVVRLNEGDNLCLRAHQGPIPVDRIKWPINRNWTAGRSFMDRQPVHVHDMLSSKGNEFPEAQERARDQGHRTILSVPLLRDGASTGTITLRRLELDPFSDKQIALLQTFADQAVIAISNVQLFEQVEERTRELSKSLHELRTAQDRLIQTEKLASLGQLTAGIAHEIKNPLNFVNNFSALSAELTDELNDVLRQATLADPMREEVDELTGLLKDNLQKVVQHGKRADSIVKNMLLHSREGSGEHRPADINALVDESLNLAYHGARAEKPHFNVTLQRDFDPKAGLIDVFPQEITRVFLNLISNGFYAVTKRKADNGAGFEPIVTASTKDLGDHVEIRIRDNGTGIPPEVKEKMFNPFFTTKPAGEGTGLGLSMSHDIIVKQHGGTIDIVTEPGGFTEFTVVLPRSKNISDKTRG